MADINIKINGMDVSAPAGSTILEAARLAHIKIPTLCYLKEINEIGACRICVVEVKGARTLVTACVYPISEGMEIFTNTPRVLESRKKTLKLWRLLRLPRLNIPMKTAALKKLKSAYGALRNS